MDITQLETKLKKCQQKVAEYKSLYDCEHHAFMAHLSGVTDQTFLEVDKSLSKRYFAADTNRLTDGLYSIVGLGERLGVRGNTKVVVLPNLSDPSEVANHWRKLSRTQCMQLVSDYTSILVFTHYFKLKQIVLDLFQVINSKHLLSSMLLCRALFEHIATLNSYNELFKSLVIKGNLNPSFFPRKGNSGAMVGDLPYSFEQPFRELVGSSDETLGVEDGPSTQVSTKETYEHYDDAPWLVYCMLIQRYLEAGKSDISLYGRFHNDWKKVIESGSRLNFEGNRFKQLESVLHDIKFLGKQFPQAHAWYSVICEFVHPNAGSHRTVFRTKALVLDLPDKSIPPNESIRRLLKEDEGIPIKELPVKIRQLYKVKYTLCTIADDQVKGHYRFAVEAFHYALTELAQTAARVLLELHENEMKFGGANP